MSGVWVVVIVLAVGTILGLWFRWGNGRIKETTMSEQPPFQQASADEPPAAIEPDPPSAEAVALAGVLSDRLGERATVVQFSSAFCQPCRATRRILEEVTVMVSGVAHVELDAEENLDLVRALDIRRTPTVLFLDAAGEIRKRASGQPRKVDVVAALGDLIPEDEQPDFEI
jgi:thiol-disulfide isomerase/thioredoxin